MPLARQQDMSPIYYAYKCYTTNVLFMQHLVQPNPLQTVQAGDTQRFYFDSRGGVACIITGFFFGGGGQGGKFVPPPESGFAPP